MKDTPFFSNRWSDYAQPSVPRYVSTVGGIPVPKPKPKVVSIPVQVLGPEASESGFSVPIQVVGIDGSETKSDSESALRIQKVWRGFRVRKNVKKILAVSIEVGEIEKKIEGGEMVESIRGSEKERVKVNEMLMALLLRLDSVGGVEGGVRDCRRAVIRRVVMLQEKIDSVDAVAEEMEDSGDSGEGNGGEIGNRTTEAKIADRTEEETKGKNDDHHSEQCGGGECEGILDNLMQEGEEGRTQVQDSDHEPESYAESESSVEGGEEAEEKGEDEMERRMAGAGPDPLGEQKRNRELLERMIEENEKMMGLMGELFERNQMQTRMLSALSRRVEQLEKAFVCDKLKMKKKKTAANCILKPN